MDVRQLQNLLQYLGYYEGRVDGISGPLTEAAITAFRQDNGMPELGAELEEVLVGAVFHGRFKGAAAPDAEPDGDFWSTVQYFGRHEFACKCGKCGGFPVEPDEAFIRKLDAFRERVGEPVYVNSGIRCPEHNADPDVGGTSDSRHLYGDAADIRCLNKTPRELYDIADEMFPTGGVGIYDWGIHVDARGHRARW
ncbi:MAG: peptidoglycan-binding protein [Oscillospiraceae bacterium]|nr:peptidoglycan-binding protein [Oscillospiraceae bacterium]